jgi:hypothetical protein
MALPAIQGLWIGSRLSTMQQLCIRSFLDHGHPFHLYVYGDVAGIPEGTTRCDGRDILPESEICCYAEGFGKGSPSLFSNLFRYKLLLDKGGWWSDLDMVCLRPLRFEQPYVFGEQNRRNGTTTANVAIIKAPAQSPLIRDCWETANGADRQALLWGQIGPHLMNAAVTRAGLREFILPPEAFYAIDFWRFDDFFTDITPPASSYGLHLWGAMWKQHGRDPDATYAEDSLYERLKSLHLGPRADGRGQRVRVAR